MKKQSFCLLLSLFAVSSAFGENVRFRDRLWGARTISMGNASIGMRGDSYSPFTNPASIALSGPIESQFSYGIPEERVLGKEKNIQSFSLISNLLKNNQGIGLWWTNSSVEDAWDENLYALSYGRTLWGDPENLSFSAGMNLKYFSYLDMANRHNRSTNLGADVGLNFSVKRLLTFGAVYQDFSRPEIAGEKLPGKMGIGTSIKVTNRTLAAIDVSNITDQDDVKVGGGIEQELIRKIIFLRAGANNDWASAGLGLKIHAFKSDFNIEYAYLYPYKLDESCRLHMATLRIAFGSKDEKEVAAVEKKEIVSQPSIEEDPRVKDETIKQISEKLRKEQEKFGFLLGPEDVIEIEVKDHPELSKTMTIDAAGFLKLPYIGNFDVKGMSPAKLRDQLRKIYSEFYTESPAVDINVREYNSRVVYVLGAVRVPGRYALGQKPLTVRDIVIQAGLPTVQAANWRAFVVRQTEDGPVYLHVNLNKLLYRGRMENNVQLQTGDTVYVPMTFLDSFASFLGRIFGPIFGISRTVVGPAAAF